jgi:hypothetical protein
MQEMAHLAVGASGRAALHCIIITITTIINIRSPSSSMHAMYMSAQKITSPRAYV